MTTPADVFVSCGGSLTYSEFMLLNDAEREALMAAKQRRDNELILRLVIAMKSPEGFLEAAREAGGQEMVRQLALVEATERAAARMEGALK